MKRYKNTNKFETYFDKNIKSIQDLGFISNYENEIINYLTVYESPYEKIRVGNNGDGGYVISSLPGKYDAIISGGIENDISFEDHFLDLHPYLPTALAFDGTIENIPKSIRNVTWIKKNLGSTNSDNLSNLSIEMEPYNDVFLKIDIEGHEYSLFSSFSDERLKKVKQLVMEIHTPADICLHPGHYRGVEDKKDNTLLYEFLKKLTSTHTLVHVHGNNGCYLQYLSMIKVPHVMECTFVRNDLFQEKKLNKTPFPTSLDYSNIKEKNDYKLNYPPFCIN